MTNTDCNWCHDGRDGVTFCSAKCMSRDRRCTWLEGSIAALEASATVEEARTYRALCAEYDSLMHSPR